MLRRSKIDGKDMKCVGIQISSKNIGKFVGKSILYQAHFCTVYTYSLPSYIKLKNMTIFVSVPSLVTRSLTMYNDA